MVDGTTMTRIPTLEAPNDSVLLYTINAPVAPKETCDDDNAKYEEIQPSIYERDAWNPMPGYSTSFPAKHDKPEQ